MFETRRRQEEVNQNINAQSAFCWLAFHTTCPLLCAIRHPHYLTAFTSVIGHSMTLENCDSTWRLAEEWRNNEVTFHVTVCYVLHNNSV